MFKHIYVYIYIAAKQKSAPSHCTGSYIGIPIQELHTIIPIIDMGSIPTTNHSVRGLFWWLMCRITCILMYIERKNT